MPEPPVALQTFLLETRHVFGLETMSILDQHSTKASAPRGGGLERATSAYLRRDPRSTMAGVYHGLKTKPPSLLVLGRPSSSVTLRLTLTLGG